MSLVIGSDGRVLMAGAGGDAAALLTRHAPILRFDSAERYFADPVEIWVQNPGARLCRADGSVIASAGGQPRLSLAFLGPERYADGRPARAGDMIVAGGRDYRAQYRRLCADPALRDRIYGHARVGSDGRLWLSYWFFSFYNDYRVLGRFIGAGLHEGDWEMIQLRLGADAAAPDLAVYAQHAHARPRPWAAVERVEGHPVVYPGRGSHACYYTPGTHWTGAGLERADGRGRAPALSLGVIDDADPACAWVHWPGRWGGTRPRTPWLRRLGLDAVSPHGPGHQRQWRDPAMLLRSAPSASG